MIPMTMELLTMVLSTQHCQAETAWRGTAHSHTLIRLTPFFAVHSQGITTVVTQNDEAENRGATPPIRQHAGSIATSPSVPQQPLPLQLSLWITS